MTFTTENIVKTIKIIKKIGIENNVSHIPRLFIRLGKRSRTAIKLLLTGQLDRVFEGIHKILVGPTDEEESDISIDNLIIITTKHTRYIGHLVQKALREVGYDSVLSEQFSKEQDVGQIHFVICPQMFSQLPKNFVAFQLEQSVNPRWFTKQYFTVLSKAHSIFEYSTKNIEFLLKNRVSYQKVFYLPISPFLEYRRYLEEIGYQINSIEEPIEVLFYGDVNCDRRQMYLASLKSAFKVYVASEVFGEELVSLVCRAKVVVNVHYYEGALLETTRIYETLSLGIPIVSESSIDIDSHCDLAGIVSFTPIGDIDAMIREVRLLLTKNSQQQRRLAILEFTQQDRKFFNYFKRFLLSNDLFDYSFNDYAREVNLVDLSKQLDERRLCLTLTEAPVRKSAFLSKPTYGFEILEGIRYYQGWIGCGMSYKYMLNKVKQSGSKYAIICEDDVVFPDDFEERINKILNYLKQAKRQWHIYSGLIADLHIDTNILAIEEYEGIEYIYIDKMTSMVMNIYSPEIIDIITRWDETDKDSKSNTIDRYIESQTGITVVTTLPYLVGHSEDQQSTLWGFMNTEYIEMIEASQKKLLEKVIEYKANIASN